MRRPAVLLGSSLIAATVVTLAAGLDPNGFYSGDPGVKLIAARNAIAHPLRPWQIDFPAIGGEPAPFVERFFSIHGDHAHALQSPVFPVMSAPFIALFGLHGAYVLPLVGFLALIAVLPWIASRLVPEDRIQPFVLVATISGPAFFYAFEFWEHVPAMACLAAAVALGLREPPSRLVQAAGGMLAGIAILLRPEAFWFVLAWLAWLAVRRRPVATAVGGLVLVVLPFTAYNWLESGTLAGPHATANLAPLTDRWLARRFDHARLWWWPAAMPAAAGALVVAAGWIGWRLGAGIRRAQAVALAGAAAVAAIAASGQFPRETLWHAWPAGVLLFVPNAKWRGLRGLWWLASFTVAAVWLSSTHEGGAQWGPRFILIATPALVILAAANAAAAWGPGEWRRVRQVLVVTVLIASAWTARTAYRELRATKEFYARLVSAVAAGTRPGSHIVFGTWWIDQVAAPLYSTRTLLYADDEAAGRLILARLTDAGVTDATLIWSREEGDRDALNGAVSGTCFRPVRTHAIPERDLQVIEVICR